MLVILLVWAGLLQAQPLNRATYSTMIETAEDCEARYDYYNAIDWYERSYEEVDDKDIAVKIGHLNMLVRDYKDAERWFKKALRRDKKGQYIEDRFSFAQSLKMNEKYDEAIQEFEAYIKEGTDDRKKQLAENEINGCEFAKIAMDKEDVTISNAGNKVNTKYSEYSAFLAPDGKSMYYASFQTDEVIVLDGKNEDYHAKILTANRTEDGWGDPTALGQAINRPGYHNSNITLSPDGNRMYFTRQLLEGNTLSESKLYVSERSGGGWGPANEVTTINGDFLVQHPAVGELYGNEVMFFVSNMDGGQGGLDLYYATYKGGGVFGDPVNLGPKLNTVGDEVTPFYLDGTLYFSSNGHPGLGGFDIFYTTWNGSLWSEPANLGKGYNTSVDDRYFMLDQEGIYGFLVSNRPGTRSVKSKTCCDDIWNVSHKIILADLLTAAYDIETLVPLTESTIYLLDMTDNRVGETKSDKSIDGSPLSFELDLDKAYMLVATRENYFPDTVEFNTVGLLDSKTFEIPLKLKPAPVYKTFTREEPITLENIYYDFNDDKILKDAEQDLELILELMEQYPDMVIELSSHTDARGEDAYNRELSQRRAESARRWLLEKGIIRRRIQAVGYGETQPNTVSARVAAQYDFLNAGDVLTEEFINALEAEEQKEAAHQINRRTEFKIIEGPTSIRIEETRLIRRGDKEVEGGEGVKEEDDKQ
ncbi:MAG: OmpA family protein [Phaeodactylibacter sp.]|nr:OmpA family protein [Phaeodactylibacter sp.]